MQIELKEDAKTKIIYLIPIHTGRNILKKNQVGNQETNQLKEVIFLVIE